VLDSPVSVHCPVLEISSRSRLSCVAWSPYVKGQLVSADYDGVVQLWDVNTNAEVLALEEHARRVWSVDVCRANPTRLVSGSDDGTIKLWSTQQEASVATIDTGANVCSVQFSPDSPHLVAAGSASYRWLLYDLRRPGAPLASVPGHAKAVSYVRFMGPDRLVTASTDNTLKLWDVRAATAAGGGGGGGRLAPEADVTFAGHLNERNFVGLSVSPDGFIACGSEDNAVYGYHRALPLPVASHSFASAPGAPGMAGGAAAAAPAGAPAAPPERSSKFVSSVCWSRSGGVLLAGNSAGDIRVLSLAP